jgi:hypothetical protein
MMVIVSTYNQVTFADFRIYIIRGEERWLKTINTNNTIFFYKLSVTKYLFVFHKFMFMVHVLWVTMCEVKF